MMIFVLQWIYGQDPPVEFTFNQSTLQAFYFFNSVTINGAPISSNDWVAAFNGDICVGARQWDESNCGGGLCDIPAMGNEGSEDTAGYMQIGDIPTFKIYDTSTGNIYDAILSEEVDGWLNFGMFMNDLLEDGILISGTGWSINPADFQYNGSITAQVQLDTEEFDILAVFVDGEIRGVVNGLESPFGNTVFPVMVYSNEISGENLIFEFYDSSLNQYIEILETIEFSSDMIVGDAIEPFILTSNFCNFQVDCLGECGGSAVEGECGVCDGDGSDDEGCGCFEPGPSGCDNACGSTLEYDECGICGGDSSCLDIDVNTIYSFSISNVYPNPFNPVVNIDLSIDIAGHLQLSVFTVDGTQIKTIYNGPSSIGESTFIWTPKNRASGFYFINAILDDRVKTQKVLFLK